MRAELKSEKNYINECLLWPLGYSGGHIMDDTIKISDYIIVYKIIW